MSRLTRDGTAETVSRDQILRHERGQGIPVQLTTSRIGNLTRLIHTLAICVLPYIHHGDNSLLILVGIQIAAKSYFTRNGTDQFQNSSTDLLTPYRIV